MTDPSPFGAGRKALLEFQQKDEAGAPTTPGRLPRWKDGQMRLLTLGINFPCDMAFLPDGRTLVAHVGAALLLWDLKAATDQPAWVDEPNAMLFRFAVSPCGRYVAGAEDRCLLIWDLAARKPARWLMAGNYEHIADVAFTPDGKEVLTVLLEGGGVVRRRVGSWRKKPGFGASRGRLGDRPAHFGGHLAVSPDGRTLATDHDQGQGGLSGIKLWDLPSGTHRRSAVCGPDPISQLVFSPDGQLLAAQHDFRRLCLYDAATLTPKAEYVPPQRSRRKRTDTVCRLAFHPDGRLLAVTGDKLLTLLDTDGLRPVRTFDWQIGRTFGVAFSRDGALAAVNGESGQVVVWDVD